MEIKALIRNLVQQCNIESISTKDLAKELGKLYQEIESLESLNKQLDANCTLNAKALTKERSEYAEFKAKYVEPVDSIEKRKQELDKERFKFDVEREYAKRENEIYKEIVRSLTTTHGQNESYYGGNNGASYNRSQIVDKPNLPGNPFAIGEKK